MKYKLASKLIEKGIIKGNNNYKKFIVLTRARTGSNLLKNLLDSHSKIYIKGEIFKHLKGKNTEGELNILYSNKPAIIQAVGFKIFYYHPSDMESDQIWQILERDKEIKVIHLKRKNILRTILSRKIAGKTDAWLMKRINKNQLNLEDKQVSFTKEECLKGFTQTKNWEITFDERFGTHQKIDVFYENLIKNQQDELIRIQQFLDVKVETLDTSLIRQNPEKLSDLIINYQDLKENFKGTEWGLFFEN